MASLTGDPHVLACLLFVQDIGVAGFAGLVAGMDNGPCRNLSDGGSAIVPILPKAARDNRSAQDHKRDERDRHHRGQPNQVLYVLEQVRLSGNGIPITIVLNGTS